MPPQLPKLAYDRAEDMGSLSISCIIILLSTISFSSVTAQQKRYVRENFCCWPKPACRPHPADLPGCVPDAMPHDKMHVACRCVREVLTFAAANLWNRGGVSGDDAAHVSPVLWDAKMPLRLRRAASEQQHSIPTITILQTVSVKVLEPLVHLRNRNVAHASPHG